MKTIIVTGSNGLIGKEVVKHFKKTHSVIEADMVNGQDLTSEIFVRDFFLKNKSEYLINLFALNDHVNNDREQKSNKIMDVSLDSVRRYMEINVTTLFSVCREFARNNENGSIVNFSSTYGLVSPHPGMYGGDEKHIAYGVSKAAVIQLSKHLAVHWAPKIRVNVVSPGGVEHKQSSDFKKSYSEFTPMNRMMKAEEICGILEYLCSEKSSYVTGSTFVIDGGWTAI
jgi:NAD(P)-dependent dehydrogenase (short-subunit alcohol dehydrogenase family)